MANNNEDLNDVLAFVTVVEQGSFTAAAQVLNLPTSTVSRRVARLEEVLGLRLLNRTTRSHSLTEPGRVFFEHSASPLKALRTARTVLGEMLEEPRGKVKMTAPLELGERFWPVLGRYLERYPKVDLEIYLAERLVDLVEEGYDLALRAGARLENTSYVARRLTSDERIMVAGANYVASHGRPTNIEDLDSHQLVVFSPWAPKSTWTLMGGSRQAQSISYRVRGRVEVNQLDLALKAVLAGTGIGQLLRSQCEAYIESGELLEVLPGSCPQSESLWVVYPSRENLAPAVRALIDMMIEDLAA